MKYNINRRSFLSNASAIGGSLLASPFIMTRTAFGSTDRITILNTFPTLANEYWQGWNAGAEQACSQLGLEYISQTFDDSAATQIAQIEQAPSLGVNAVVTFAQNAEIMQALCDTAARVGIKIANAHSTPAWRHAADPRFKNAYLLYSQPDNIRGTATMVRALLDRIGNSGRVLYVGGLPGNFSADSRAAGVYQALSENPNVTLVAEQPGGENRVAARPVFENMLTANPNIDAVISYNDDTAIAVLDVLRERGLTGKIITAGIDATSEMLNRVQQDDSAIGTISINAPFMTGYSVVNLYDELEGVTFDPLERMRYFDSLFIDTPEAASAYLAKMNLESELPFDYRAMSRAVNGDNWRLPWGVEIIDPTNLWSPIDSMVAVKPADYALPEEVQASLDAGNLETLNKMYASHSAEGPIGAVTALTTSGSTVLGR